MNQQQKAATISTVLKLVRPMFQRDLHQRDLLGRRYICSALVFLRDKGRISENERHLTGTYVMKQLRGDHNLEGWVRNNVTYTPMYGRQYDQKMTVTRLAWIDAMIKYLDLLAQPKSVNTSRADAVNLARDLIHDPNPSDVITNKGIKLLCKEVLRKNAAFVGQGSKTPTTVTGPGLLTMRIPQAGTRR